MFETPNQAAGCPLGWRHRSCFLFLKISPRTQPTSHSRRPFLITAASSPSDSLCCLSLPLPSSPLHSPSL